MVKGFDRGVGISIDIVGLYEMQANRPPFLLMDSAFCVVKDKQAGSEFTFASDWYLFDCHFPAEPLVPATIILEMMMQTAALAPLLARRAERPEVSDLSSRPPLVYLAGVNSSKVIKKVTPDTCLNTTSAINWRKGAFGIAEAEVVEAHTQSLIAKANFTFSCGW